MRRFRLACAVSWSLFVTAVAHAQIAAPSLSVETAEKMVAACVAYARAHRGAANIWVYDYAGAIVRFQRMDGAPPTGAPMGGDYTDVASAPGRVAVSRNGQEVGAVRVAGMTPFDDRACAQAAAAAAAGG